MPDSTDDPKTTLRHHPPGGPVVYADVVQILLNYFGFRLYFGSQRPRNPGESLEIDATLGIGMSPEHAKSLHRVLGRQIDRYEQQFGMIRSEPEKAKDHDGGTDEG